MLEKVILQVALDFENLDRALKICEEAVKGGADWIEAGTPLIKSEGINAIRELKTRFRGHKIVADMKIMDVGGFETEIGAKAGADIITVLGASDDETIKEAVRAGRNYGAEIMLDLMGVKDKVNRIKETKDYGYSYICLHVGVDQQMRGENPVEELQKISKVSSVPIAVAGGINSETAAKMVEFGASIIIVGGAIIKAKNVVEATQNIRKAIDEKKVIYTELFKKYTETELYEAYIKVSTPNISDAMHRKGAMKDIIPRIKPGTKMVGRALTVLTMDGDWAKPVEAIDRAKPGDVIVINAQGGKTAVWGELASWSCKTKKIAGVVVDGSVRDIDEIMKMEFPVFSRYIVPNAGEPKGYGEIGTEIVCGGVTVQTGDWIIGDENGVVVVPKEISVEIANRALDVLERENRIREEIKSGGTLSSVQKLEKWEKVG